VSIVLPQLLMDMNINFLSLDCISGVRQIYAEHVMNLWNSLPPSVRFTSLSLFRHSNTIQYNESFVVEPSREPGDPRRKSLMIKTAQTTQFYKMMY